MSERQFWIGLNLVQGIGPVRVRQLLEHFGALSEAWRASPEALQKAGLDRRALRSLVEARRRVDLEAEVARLDKLGIGVLTWEDEDYPVLLAQLRPIDQAPPVLYVRGSLAETDEWAIAVVGTRSVTPYGRQVTHQLVSDLAANGLTVVSGLARGVDAEAHQAALEAGGRTIAVLACGMDDIYPPEHRMLAARIVRQGALISPFPLGARPLATNFSARNRVLSGLARGVLVTLEQGREVFAVPGNITAQGSAGTNRLIQDGAHPVLNVRDVLDVLKLEQVAQFANARETLPAMSDIERAVVTKLSADPVHIDELTQRCGLSVALVSSALVTLELKGMVRQVGPMTYVRL